MGKRILLIVLAVLLGLFWLSTTPMAAQLSGFLAEKLGFVTSALSGLLG